MTDLDEAAGQHVQKEAPDELYCIQGHLFDLVMVFRVAPTKAHAAFVHAQQSPIGNGDAMGVSRQIMQHLLRPAEGRLDVRHPFFLFQRHHPIRKSGRVSEFVKGSGEAQATSGEGLLQVSEELAPEQAAERFDRQKEVFFAGRDPAMAVGR